MSDASPNHATPMPITIHIADTLESFTAAVRPTLERDPIVNTTALGVLAVLDVGGSFGDSPPLFAWAREEDRIAGAALCTPPRPLVLAATAPPVARLLATALSSHALTGVGGPADATRAFAAQWSHEHAVRTHEAMCDLQYRLTRVIEPRRKVSGVARVIESTEDALLHEWMPRFADDAKLPRVMDVDRLVRGRRASGGRFSAWIDGGEARCLVGHTARLCGVPRIGPVYTPAAHRGRGYAQALTAAVCRRLLDEGASGITLFADGENPASNAAYRAVGFEPVGERVEIAFDESR